MTIRPLLRPGSVVLRRDAHHLQVGTTPGLILADSPGVAAVLQAADGLRTVPELAEVARHQGATDGDRLVAELLARGALVAGTVGGRRLRVDLRHDAGGALLANVVRTLIAPHAAVQEDPEALVIAVSAGEPARTCFRELGYHGIRHLPIVLIDDHVRVGPLVVPGVTPCLDCHDHQRATTDPAWAALVPQFGSRWPSLVGAGADVVAVAAGEAAKVVEDLRLGRPSRLAGQTALIGPPACEVVRTRVGFDHRCGCGLLAA